MLDRVTHRKALKDELVTILRMLTGQSPAVKGDLPAPEEAASAPEAVAPPKTDAKAKPEAGAAKA